METANTYQRAIAGKVTLQEVHEGIVENDEQGAAWLRLPEKKLSRVNVVGTLLQKELLGTLTNLLVDDGTGMAVLRFFEQNPFIDQLQIGDCLLVIGKVRVFNLEKYISPEIVKKIPLLWLKVRAMESQRKGKKEERKNGENNSLKEKSFSQEEQGEAGQLPTQKIIALIRELDHGDGAPMQEIIEKSPLQDTEQLLEHMMEHGDIFQILPGKVKVL